MYFTFLKLIKDRNTKILNSRELEIDFEGKVMENIDSLMTKDIIPHKMREVIPQRRRIRKKQGDDSINSSFLSDNSEVGRNISLNNSQISQNNQSFISGQLL